MKSSLLLTLLFFSFASFAQKFEYKVVYVAGTASGTLEQSGGYLDKAKTDILNQLAQEGWELVSVT
jgi:hypothetical protein